MPWVLTDLIRMPVLAKLCMRVKKKQAASAACFSNILIRINNYRRTLKLKVTFRAVPAKSI